jgi:DNA invertase Pin-like site-specific DNA recombinase
MQARLCDLGWTEIEIIDEDLGRSAAGTETRSGFERMVAEVSLGHVGAVAAREVSRFARITWHAARAHFAILFGDRFDMTR